MAVGIAPGAALADNPDTGQVEDELALFSSTAFEPLLLREREDIPSVQQPDWWRNPVWQRNFGSGLLPAGQGIESVAVGEGPSGSPLVYVSTARTNRVYAFNTATPSAAPFSFGSGPGPAALTDAAGIAYWHGHLYVVDRSRASPDRARVVVYDAGGNYEREFPLLNPLGRLDMTGIDVAHGEVWVTGALCGGFAGIVEIFDAGTGVPKGITATTTRDPTGDPSKPCDASADPSAWWDLASVPELDAAMAGYRQVKRHLLAPLSLPDPELLCLLCNTRLWYDGMDGVWGMRWLLAVDGPNRASRGTAVTEYSFDPLPTGDTFLSEHRHWNVKQSATGGVRDVHYQNREVRIDWSGTLAESKQWLRGQHCLDYIVSDADIYPAGDQVEQWYELARGFQSIEFFIDGVSVEKRVGSQYVQGQFCRDTGNPDLTSRSLHRLTAVAVVDPTGTGQTRQVSKERDDLRVDNRAPSGSLGAPGEYARGTITASGTLADDHSGPESWQLQVKRDGGNWQTACTQSARDAAVGRHSCQWRTDAFSDGAYSLRARLLDQAIDQQGKAGNESYAPEVRTTVDNTPPELTEPAPAVGSDYAEQIQDNRAEILFAQTDATSGMDRTDLEYNIARDGSDSGQWAPADAPPARHSGDGSTTWDTTQVPDGLHRIRATSRDKAGNARSYQWQAVFSARRRCGESGVKGIFRCYGGNQLGEFNSQGKYIAGHGARAHIRAPNYVPKGRGFTLNVLFLGGSARRSLEVGMNNQNCEDPDRDRAERWWSYAQYQAPLGTVRATPCYARVPLNGERRYGVAIGRNDQAYVTVSGRVRAVVDGRRRYRLGSNGTILQSYGETDVYGRDIGGRFSAVDFLSETTGRWRNPIGIVRTDQGAGYHSEYYGASNGGHGTDGNPGYFCVHGPKRGCTPPSP